MLPAALATTVAYVIVFVAVGGQIRYPLLAFGGLRASHKEPVGLDYP